jgi:hypothetical protein
MRYAVLRASAQFEWEGAGFLATFHFSLPKNFRYWFEEQQSIFHFDS